MLKISASQMLTMRAASIAGFTHEMVRHIRRFCPRLVHSLSSSELLGIVGVTIQQARARGFTRRGPLRLWVEFSFMFGSGFTEDPMLPWIGAVLTDNDEDDQMERAWRLHDLWPVYREAVLGPSHEFYVAALRRVDSISELDTRKHIPGNAFIAEILGKIYPERLHHAGLQAHQQLVRKALTMSHGIGSDSPSDVFLIAILMSFVGHDCFRDPRHAWLGEALIRFDDTDPTSIFDSLRRTSIAYLKTVLRTSGTRQT